MRLGLEVRAQCARLITPSRHYSLEANLIAQGATMVITLLFVAPILGRPGVRPHAIPALIRTAVITFVALAAPDRRALLRLVRGGRDRGT